MNIENEITGDLMSKVGDDVSRSIRRVIAISPEPHLPIALSGAAAALGIVCAVLDKRMGKSKGSDGPGPDSVLLAGLLAAHLGISGGDGIANAYRDFYILRPGARCPQETASE